MRKNIFEIINENYNIVEEALKIRNLFSNENYFYFPRVYQNDGTFEDVIDMLLPTWSKSGAILNSHDFLIKANAEIGNEESIVNFLEVMENFILLLSISKSHLQYEGIVARDTFPQFCRLISVLEQKMGLEKKKFDNYVLLYPQNAPLEKVLAICDNDTNAQWELINYLRGDLSLSEKKKALGNFATVFAIEKDQKEKGSIQYGLIDKATNILNNLKIRHTNNDEISVVDQIGEQEQIALCDYTYSLILTIILLREQEKYKSVYSEFHNKQKEYKEKKKKGENDNG